MGSTVESKYNEVGYNEFPLLRSLHSQELILTVDLNITHMTNPTDPRIGSNIDAVDPLRKRH